MNMITKKILRELPSIGNEATYVLDMDRFISNFREFKHSFEYVFGKENVIIGYSFKTNSYYKILDTVQLLGGYAEIVSPAELVKAIYHDFDYKGRIIYNGVIHDACGKYEVALNGGIVNVDSYSHLKELSNLAMRRKEDIKLGIRVMLNDTTRFGLKYGSQEWYQVLKEFDENQYIKLAGIHCHSYGGRNLKAWERKAEMAAKIGKDLEVEYIDFGSNMYGFMEKRLAKQFADKKFSPLSYAKVIHKSMVKVYGKERKLPKVIMEPGTPIVADTMAIVSNVTDIRKVDDRYIITTDCSIYDMGFLPMTKVVPMDVVSKGLLKGEEINVKNATIYGYTCTEGDIVYRNFTGRIGVGDKLVFGNLGAYGRELSNDFIKDRLLVHCLKQKKPLF